MPNIGVMGSPDVIETYDAPVAERIKPLFFGIRNATYLNEILEKHPRTPDMSQAQDLTTGDVYTLLRDENNPNADPWIKMGG